MDPFDLSIISQKDCPWDENEGVNININPKTFTAESVAEVVRKAGEKLGDGIEYVAEGAKDVYHKYADGDKSNGRLIKPNPDAEWLP